MQHMKGIENRGKCFPQHQSTSKPTALLWKAIVKKATKVKVGSPSAAAPWDGTINSLISEVKTGISYWSFYWGDGRKKSLHFFQGVGKLPLTWDPSHCGLKIFGMEDHHIFFLFICTVICLFNGIKIKSSWNGFLIKIILCLSEWEHLTDYKRNVETSGILFPILQPACAANSLC